ncbi:hypothetical protein K0504_09920 [Neiella marina]|uniref:Uncharacterized protein n=1 Tax=Neiella holothuriorum TaxID=2870530 RepID=A0ABS7EGM2_9GAMM|nr:hypothetical protein [Neiella holothuriorum]MBW8191354.1 hypothetical protein [Neiella holothuriorum]
MTDQSTSLHQDNDPFDQQNYTSTITVEGLPYPIEPMELLGFQSPMSDNVLQVLTERLGANLNRLERSLFDQIIAEARRARAGEVQSRSRALFMHMQQQKMQQAKPAEEALNANSRLTAPQRELVKKSALWIRTMTIAEVKEVGIDNVYLRDPVISDADIDKSSLFARIRQGLKPLPNKPPTAFGQPWYDVIENDGEFLVKVDIPSSLCACGPGHASGQTITINQCSWPVIEVVAVRREYVVSWSGTNRSFKLFKSDEILRNQGGTETGWILKAISP